MGIDPATQYSDAGSETSTVVYSHEPFTTYQTRVLDLVCALYGSATAKSAQIARLPGGGFNRIIRITLPASSIEITLSAFNSQDLDLILRIPRFDCTDVAVQVSVLRALGPSLPVPWIEHYDARSDNALGQPYVLMRRLTGHNLHDTLFEMTTNERCQIAKQVAELIVKIHAVSLPPGIGPLSADDTGQLRIMQFPVDPLNQDHEWVEKEAEDVKPPLMTFHSFVSTRIADLRALAQQHDPPDTFRLKLLDKFVSASSTLLDAYALPSSSIALFHRDFAARNILVTHNTDRTRWSISGVLDWDECEAAPLEISGVWPGWLWASDQEGEADFEENEWDPDLPVLDDKSERIKKSFVDEIEKLKPGFLDMVRRTRDGCLRLVYERAREGFFSNEHVKELDRIEEAAKKLTVS